MENSNTTSVQEIPIKTTLRKDSNTPPDVVKATKTLTHSFLTTPYPAFWDIRTSLHSQLSNMPLVDKASVLLNLNSQYRALEEGGHPLDTDRQRQIAAIYQLGVHGINRPLNPKEKQSSDLREYLGDHVFDKDRKILKMRWEIDLVRLRDKIDGLSNLGLNPAAILIAWEHSGYVMEENLAAVSELEEKRPGAAAYLVREFGIKDFARYPIHMLTEQFDEAENTDLPYGVLVYPQWDHFNGAAEHMRAFYQDKKPLDDFHKSLGRRHLIRIIEGNDMLELGRTISNLRRRYEQKQKISFMMVAGHGDKDIVDFGRGGKSKLKNVSRSMIKDTYWETGMQKAFVKNPIILFNSCSAGEDASLAQVASEKFQATTIASKGEFDYITSLQGNYAADGTLSISATFDHSPTVIYRDGEKMSA